MHGKLIGWIIIMDLPHIRLSLFGDCNIRCVYCPPWGENRYTINPSLDATYIKAILERLSHAGFTVVKLTGGEPTLRKDLIEIVNHAVPLFKEVRLITNGWNLMEIASDIARSGLSVVEVSMDAMTQDVFDQITQTSGLYSKVIGGINKCKEVSLPVQINTVVMRQNLNQLARLCDFVQLRGNTTLKLLELVYYEFPGYQFWKDNFVDSREVVSIVQPYAISVDTLTPPGGFGSPMLLFHLNNDSQVLVKDGTLGSTYANMCRGCPVFPCQDGLYGLAVTTEGFLKMCKHRPDLDVHLGQPEKEIIDVRPAIDDAIKTIIERYRSAYFCRNGWDPSVAEQHAKRRFITPAKGVVSWYRKKEYGSGFAESLLTDGIANEKDA